MVVAGAMWSAPPPLAAVASAVWAAAHNVLAMAGAIYSHSRVIVENYPWQCVIALTVMIASCIGTYFARRYVNSRVGDRHSYVQVVPEEVTPRATTPGRRTCAWVGYAILTVIVGLTVMVSAVIAAWAFFLWVPRQYVPALAIAMALGMDAFIAWRYMGRDKAATCRCAVHVAGRAHRDGRRYQQRLHGALRLGILESVAAAAVPARRARAVQWGLAGCHRGARGRGHPLRMLRCLQEGAGGEGPPVGSR